MSRSRSRIVRALEWTATGFWLWLRALPRFALPALIVWAPLTWFVHDAADQHAEWLATSAGQWRLRGFVLLREALVVLIVTKLLIAWRRDERLDFGGAPRALARPFFAVLAVRLVVALVMQGMQSAIFAGRLRFEEWFGDDASPWVTVALVNLLPCVILPVSGLAIASVVAVAEEVDAFAVFARAWRLARAGLATLCFATVAGMVALWPLQRGAATLLRALHDTESRILVSDGFELFRVTLIAACAVVFHGRLRAAEAER